jgi:hypothetical protein
VGNFPAHSTAMSTHATLWAGLAEDPAAAKWDTAHDARGRSVVGASLPEAFLDRWSLIVVADEMTSQTSSETAAILAHRMQFSRAKTDMARLYLVCFVRICDEQPPETHVGRVCW